MPVLEERIAATDCHADTLDWVNQMRLEYDLGGPLRELPIGNRCHGFECPLGRALWGFVGYEEFYPGLELDSDAPCVPLPQAIQTWVRHFDAGEFPELVVVR